MTECTCGPCTAWCPIHGNCTCPRDDDGYMVLRLADESVSLREPIVELMISDDCPIRHERIER